MHLKEYLHQAGLSETAFSEMVGVSQQAVSRYASGKRIPRSAVLTRITEATDGQVTANDFHGGCADG